jgi:hypothetical protein
METREQLEEIVRLASERLGQVVTVEMVRAVQSATFAVRYKLGEPLKRPRASRDVMERVAAVIRGEGE